MTDWRQLYEQRNWARIEDWWRYEASHAELVELRDALRRDVTREKIENGVEVTEDFAHPWQAPHDWEGAAEMLYTGELDAKIDGEPPSGQQVWQEEASKIRQALEPFLDAGEVTEGDVRLSRKAHAEQSLERLSEIECWTQRMCQQVEPEDREWIAEAIAEAALSGFAAGSHARAAMGKKAESLAVRGAANLRHVSEGGKATSLQRRAAKEALFARMRESIDRGHTVEAAAEHACKEGYGKSKTANSRAWYREKEVSD